MKPDVPIFDIGARFDTTVRIGEHEVPVHIKRFSRAELEAFEKQYAALALPPRGADETPEALEARAAALVPFCEKSLIDAVTVDEGWIVNLGKPVVDGAGVMAAFYSRGDILRVFLDAIYTENKLNGIILKNLHSPRASGSGSDASIPVRGGDAQGSSAAPAELSSTASSAPAAERLNAMDADEPSSCGEIAVEAAAAV